MANMHTKLYMEEPVLRVNHETEGARGLALGLKKKLWLVNLLNLLSKIPSKRIREWAENKRIEYMLRYLAMSSVGNSLEQAVIRKYV